MVEKFETKGDIHFQSDLFNGSEEDGEPNTNRRYEPHVLEIHTPEPKIISEKTIFLDPVKYQFNKQTKHKGDLEKFLYWLIR